MRKLANIIRENSLSLALFALFVLSIFLRQEDSAESKPADAPNSETGKHNE